MKRRDVLRYSAAGAATAASALVGAQALANPDTPKPAPDRTKAAPGDPRDFSEVYKGKRIRGRYNMGNLAGDLTGSALSNGALGAGTLGATVLSLAKQNEVYINDRALALTAIPTMFFPTDGRKPYAGIGLISAINHYDPVELELNPNCLRKLMMKVVDILGDLELSSGAAQEHTH
ncbi:tyrosinase family oxidase copper chaperone [Actinoplanes sp. G11-F43]|uniref:tyrosinase family oxidase copper chaperone n=1 Tax=Actinoplanes sp. G11-F43 TaxID=3424130 RepID=UPI003D33DBFA